MRRLNVFMRHVHGGYMNAFVQGPHTYLLPVRDGSPQGRRRAAWPASVREVTSEAAAGEQIDVVIYQNAAELEEFEEWFGTRRPGIDFPAVYLEHNAPQGRINELRHPLADRDGVSIVHVTHFNALFWDTGSTPARVIEHGISDPGYRYTGEIERCAVLINEAARRARVTGTDLLQGIEREAAPYDLYGIGARDLPTDELHDEIARRRLYLHPYRWTSLGLSLLEAMHLGMPVVALATTEAPYAVPPGTGVVSNRIDEIHEAVRWLMRDPKAAREMGERGREHALQRYNLQRFLADWDALFASVAR